MTKRDLTENRITAYSASKYIIGIVTGAITVMAYCFWAFPYRAALSYREQLQLFQTTGSYFNDLASRPGGLATYAGEFLTQFFNNFWIGSAIFAILFLMFMLLCYRLNRRFSPSTSRIGCIILATIPLTAIWLYFGNPDVTLSFLTALLLAVAGANIFTATPGIQSTSEKYIQMIGGTTLLYWLAGQVTIVYTLLIIAFVSIGKQDSKSIGKPNSKPIKEQDSRLDVEQDSKFNGKMNSVSNKAVFAIISILWLVANLFIWSLCITYPLSYQLIGIGYLMMPDTLNAGQVIVEVLSVAVPLLVIVISRMPQKITLPALMTAEIIAVFLFFPKSYNETTYRLIDYDYMVRTNDWDGIIQYSDSHNPDLPLSVCATNLALGMRGELDSRAFAYFQHGAEGLVPPFVKETLSSWTTGEALFQLGMINSAQRFYFEGMEAIPNYNKSSRAIKRLAETAMIRGEYVLAEKYLRILENTIFYKKWAKRNIALIKEKGGIERHPLYGRLRSRMVDEEYMFSEGELDKTFGQLYLTNPGNNLAKQYLIVYPLLQRDLNKFAQYMGVVAEKEPHYNPILAQQALAFMAMKNGQTMPEEAVSKQVEQSLRDFAQAWTSKDPERIKAHSLTLYHYLLSDK